MGTLSAAALGAILFGVACVCLKKNKLNRGTSWLMLAAGACLSGMLGAIIGWITTTAGTVGGTVTGIVFGAAVPAVLTFVAGTLLWIEMHPKTGRATRGTPWMALLFVPLVVATVGGVMAALPARINELVLAAGNAVSQALGDVVGRL
ncbi:hypothetical protein ABZV93_04565 [Actinopolymorpha sp. NPDC004070]|uniref:hypothetical protein n=1 Tax=Actinopolymorpha sp. NPDC004070 TaxID=3154548 RepID=UPI0033B3F9CC